MTNSEKNGKKPHIEELEDQLKMMDASGAGINQVKLLNDIMADYLTASLDGAPDVKLERSFNPKDALIGQIRSSSQILKQIVHGGDVNKTRLLNTLKTLFNSLFGIMRDKDHSGFFSDPNSDLGRVADILERFASTYGVREDFRNHVADVLLPPAAPTTKKLSWESGSHGKELSFGGGDNPAADTFEGKNKTKTSSPRIKIYDSLPPPPGEYRDMVDSLLPPESRINRSEKERAANSEFMEAFDELLYSGTFEFPHGEVLDKATFDRQLYYIIDAAYQTVEFDVLGRMQEKNDGIVSDEEEKYPNFRRVYENEKFSQFVAEEQAGGDKEILLANLQAHVRNKLEERANRVMPDVLDIMEQWIKSDPDAAGKDSAELARDLIVRYYDEMSAHGITPETPEVYRLGLYFFHEGLGSYLRVRSSMHENRLTTNFYDGVQGRIKKCGTGATLPGIPAADQPSLYKQLFQKIEATNNDEPPRIPNDAEAPELDIHGFSEAANDENTDAGAPSSFASIGDALASNPQLQALRKQMESSLPPEAEEYESTADEDAYADEIFDALINDAAQTVSPQEEEEADDKTVVDATLPSFEDSPAGEPHTDGHRSSINLPDDFVESIGRVSHPEVITPAAGDAKYTEDDDEPTEIFIPSVHPSVNDETPAEEKPAHTRIEAALAKKSTIKNLAAPPAREGEHGGKGAAPVVIRQSNPPEIRSGVSAPHIPPPPPPPAPPAPRRRGSLSRTLPFGSDFTPSAEVLPRVDETPETDVSPRGDAASLAGTLIMNGPALESSTGTTAGGTVVLPTPAKASSREASTSEDSSSEESVPQIEQLIKSGQDISSMLERRDSRSSLYGLSDYAATKSMMEELPPGSIRPELLQEQPPPEPPMRKSGKGKYVIAGAAALGIAGAIYGLTRPDTVTDTADQKTVAGLTDTHSKTATDPVTEPDEKTAEVLGDASADSRELSAPDTSLDSKFENRELSSVGQEVKQRMKNNGLNNKNGIGAWIFTNFMGSNAKPEQIQAMKALMDEFNRASYYDALVTYLQYSQKEINEILYDRSHPQHRELRYLATTIGHPYKWVNPDTGAIFSWNETERRKAAAEIEKKHAQSLSMFKNFKETINSSRLRQGLNIRMHGGGIAVQQLSIHDAYLGEHFAMDEIAKSQIFHLLDEIRNGDLKVAENLRNNSYGLNPSAGSGNDHKHGFYSPENNNNLSVPALDVNDIFGSSPAQYAYLPGKNTFTGLTDEECGIGTLPSVERADYLTGLYSDIRKAADSAQESLKNSAVSPIFTALTDLSDEDILDITDMDPSDPRIEAHAQGVPWVELEDKDIVEIAELSDEDIVDITYMNEKEKAAALAKAEGKDLLDLDIEALNVRIKISTISADRREALLNRGEVLVPNTADGLPGSVKLAFLNGLIRECDTIEQQNAIERLCERELKLGNLIEYEVITDENGKEYTYGKAPDNFMKKSLEILAGSPNNATCPTARPHGDSGKIALEVRSEINKTLEEIDAGWDVAA